MLAVTVESQPHGPFIFAGLRVSTKPSLVLPPSQFPKPVPENLPYLYSPDVVAPVDVGVTEGVAETDGVGENVGVAVTSGEGDGVGDDVGVAVGGPEAVGLGAGISVPAP